MKNYSIVEGGICAPKGFYASGIYSGVKRSKNKDLALLFSSSLANCAGVFTKNKVKAAPIILSQKVVKTGYAQSIVINSGNANACTGKKGMKDAELMQKEVALSLKISQKNVLVASTGVIGVPMPMKKIKPAIWIASRMLSTSGSSDFAKAILTTDLTKKEIAVKVYLSKGKSFVIGGVAKGSGMICPNMATMIGVITTDAKITSSALQKSLSNAVDNTFNMITVDNDTSTNDCVFALANGSSAKISTKVEQKIFDETLNFVCEYLAKEIAKDGEGATKLFEISVLNAKTKFDAQKAAKTIAGSNLFKCAVYGADPNIGRVLAAIGYSGADIDPNRVDVRIKDMLLVKNGVPVKFNSKKASSLMKEKSINITVDLKIGKFGAKAWGCDLTEKYIDINARYHT